MNNEGRNTKSEKRQIAGHIRRKLDPGASGGIVDKTRGRGAMSHTANPAEKKNAQTTPAKKGEGLGGRTKEQIFGRPLGGRENSPAQQCEKNHKAATTGLGGKNTHGGYSLNRSRE